MSAQNQASQKPAGRIIYLDAIRAISIALVVLLHAAGQILHGFPQSSRWWAANIYDSLTRPYVPLFVMVSGAILLHPAKTESLLLFFRKRFLKVAIPFLIWAIIYFQWRKYFHHESISPYRMLSEILQGPVYFHLWFIYLILSLYLVTPILRVYVRHATQRDLAYFIGLWFFQACVLQIITALKGYHWGIYLYVVTDYVGYFVLGYYLRDLPSIKLRPIACGALLLIAAAVTAIGTYVIDIRAGGKFSAVAYDDISPNVVVMTICAFLLIRDLFAANFAGRHPVFSSMFTRLSAASFGVYLIHPIVLELLASGKLGFALSGSTGHPAIGVPLTASITFLISLLLIMLMQKIPGVSTIVP